MKTTAIPILQPQLPSSSRLTTRLSEFFALMKPRVMLLAVFTALVGLMIAPAKIDPVLGFIAILAIATGAGAAGMLNMWYDADIDAVMPRTAGRPIPLGRVSRTEALSFGLVLAGGAVAVLGLAVNLKAGALLAFAIFFYAVVYTAWLKRTTSQNIVIGGAAGALPPVIGWAAATGDVGVEPLILFLIVFLWTPPHFWALALNRVDEYARAGVPMLPVVAGRSATSKQILSLQPASAASLNTAVGARLYRRSLRRGCRHLRCDLCCARGSSAQKPWGQSARRASPIRILHFVPVPVVRSVAGQQHQSINSDAFGARRCSWIDRSCHLRRPSSNNPRSVPGDGRRGLRCGTLC